MAQIRGRKDSNQSERAAGFSDPQVLYIQKVVRLQRTTTLGQW